MEGEAQAHRQAAGSTPYHTRGWDSAPSISSLKSLPFQFELRVLDIFTEASDFVVVQFGPTPRSKRDITGSS